jgi:DNA-binding beta-propeller fold protein YncE
MLARVSSSFNSSLGLGAALLAAATAGCSGGGGSSRPLLLTMNGTGRFSVVHLNDPNKPGLATAIALGSNLETLAMAPDRTFALAADADTASITVVDLHDLRRPTPVALETVVFSNPLGPVVVSPAEPSAVLFDATRNHARTMELARLDAPVLSPELELPGAAAGIFPSVRTGTVVLSLSGRGGEVSALEASDATGTLRSFPWPTAGSPTSVAFSPLPGELALAADGADRIVVVLDASDVASSAEIAVGTVDLGGSPVLAVATARTTATGLAITADGEIFTIDFADPAAPTVTSHLPLGRGVAAPVLAFSADDRFALAADAPSGRFGVFRVDASGALANAGSFALSAAITRTGFTSDLDARDFQTNPFAFALAGGNLFLLDLAPAVPVLAAPLNFSAIPDFFVDPPRFGNSIVGVDTTGRVVVWHVSHPQQPSLLSTTDVGIGAGAKHSFFAVDPAD